MTMNWHDELKALDRISPSRDLWSDALARASSRTSPARSIGMRRRGPVAAIAAVAVLAAIVVATPAWGVVRDVLPFWDQPSAPSSVKVEFASLNVGAPTGMSPQAVSDDTREVEQVTLGGATRTLWVSPAKDGGFCFIWLPGAGGGCSPSDEPLTTEAMLVPAHDPNQPAQTTGIPEDTQDVSVPEWITGDVTAPTTDVAIYFSDGSTVHPRIVWVSAPINAGFFAYDVPASKQSSTVHVTEVNAYNQDATLVKRDSFPPAQVHN
jgi:hypothetical protein